MNKMRRSRSSDVEFSMGTKEAPGVYGKGGGAGFENYPQSKGKDTIVTKTMETSFGTANEKSNTMRRSTETIKMGQAGKKATSSTMKTSKNKYRSSRGNTAEFK